MCFLHCSFSCGCWDLNAFHKALMFSTENHWRNISSHLPFQCFYSEQTRQTVCFLFDFDQDYSFTSSYLCIWAALLLLTTIVIHGDSWWRKVLPPRGKVRQGQTCWCCWTAGSGLYSSASLEGSIWMWVLVCVERKKLWSVSPPAVGNVQWTVQFLITFGTTYVWSKFIGLSGWFFFGFLFSYQTHTSVTSFCLSPETELYQRTFQSLLLLWNAVVNRWYCRYVQIKGQAFIIRIQSSVNNSMLSL